MTGRRKTPKKLAYGVGLDDSDYVVSTKVDGKSIIVCRYWDRWRQMLRRAYSEEWHKKKPSYRDVEVCDEWLVFSKFKQWMKTQDWKGKQLDKDVIGNGLLYSPENCVFLSSRVNCLIKKPQKRKSDLPRGVDKHQCGYGYIGTFRQEGKRKAKYFKDLEPARLYYLDNTSKEFMRVALHEPRPIFLALLQKSIIMRQQMAA